MRRIATGLLAVVVTMGAGSGAALAEKVRVAVQSPILISDTVPYRDRERIEPSLIVGPFEGALRSSRKFELYSRRGDIRAQTAQEQKLKSSPFREAGNASFEPSKPVQYIMSISLHDLKFRRDEDKAHNIDRYRRIDIARATIETQVLKVANDRIAFRGQVTEEISTDPKLVTQPGGRPDISLLSKVAGKAADKLVSKFLSNVFPITVLKTKQGFAFLNYGGDSLSNGQVFDVYGTGLKLEGVDTGETIEGGLHKGTVKVTQVNPKYSIAKIVEQNAPIERGDVLRSSD